MKPQFPSRLFVVFLYMWMNLRAWESWHPRGPIRHPTTRVSYRIGYAGGIGPTNVRPILTEVRQAANGQPFLIDTESQLLTSHQCYYVIAAAYELGLVKHPETMA